MQRVPEKKFPVCSKDYKLYEEVGEGVSATVYRALCIPLNEIVAIKVLDLEKCNNDLDGIRREVQTMTLIDHPNLLRAHCSFTADRSLWVVMPYLAGGSCLHMMKSAHPDGLEEPVIATLLHEVLKALVYLHSHGHIHRDVKAGNILIDFNGSIKLADFGVSACMFDTGDRQRSRNTFVGTPCWMAPEVMQQLHGYDFKADIWSFGITALELAHGHAPFSKYPPMKVLLMTLQNAPPGLDYERDKKFSKSFKELVATCLVKDPKKRPTSEKLLKHHFFKNARSNEYLAKYILEGVAPLGERFRDLKAKEADFLVQNKLMHGDKEQLSQQEYIRGISAWNFNLEDLKMQAALIQNDEGISYPGDTNCNSEKLCIDVSQDMHNNCKAASPQEDGLCDPKNAESSLASFPIRPLQALKGHFDISEDDNVSLISPKWEDALQLDSENIVSSPEQRQKFVSGSLLPEQILPSSRTANGDKENVHQKNQRDRSYSGSLLDPRKEISNHASFALHALDETTEGTIVQQKGRFKVTSDAGLKAAQSTNCSPTTSCGAPAKPTIMTTSVLPSLQYIFQQSNMQREQIIKLIKYVDLAPGHQADVNHFAINDVSKLSPASFNRERELKFQLSHLQKSIGSLTEELQKVKTKNAQLELKLIAIGRKERMPKVNREH